MRFLARTASESLEAGEAQRAPVGEYLKRRDVDVWIEPRVVWAVKGKLWLKRPMVRVWQFNDPAYLLEDVQKGKPTHDDVVLNALR